MRYQIVSVSGLTFDKTIEKLTNEVNDMIALGWEPLGGMVVVGSRYVQTMVRRR